MASLEDIKQILLESQSMWAQAHKELLSAVKTKSTGTKSANDKDESGFRLPDMSGAMPNDMRQIFGQFQNTLKQIFGNTNLAKFENTLKLTLGQLMGQAGGSVLKKAFGTGLGAAAGTVAGQRLLNHTTPGFGLTPAAVTLRNSYAPVLARLIKANPQLYQQYQQQKQQNQQNQQSEQDDEQQPSRFSRFRKSLFSTPTSKFKTGETRKWFSENISKAFDFRGQGPLAALGREYKIARFMGRGELSSVVGAPFRASGRAVTGGFKAARVAGSAAWGARSAGVLGAARGGAMALGAGARAGLGAGMATLGLSNPAGWAVTIALAIPAIAGFTSMLYKSQEALKDFSGGMARTFAKSEIREFKRNLASARSRERVTGWLGEQSEQWKDNMRPLWDLLFNVLGSILAGIMWLVNTIIGFFTKIFDTIRWAWNKLPDWITGGDMEDPAKKAAADLGPFGNLLREFGAGRADKWQDKTLFNWGGI
jgi:hypothetical protein